MQAPSADLLERASVSSGDGSVLAIADTAQVTEVGEVRPIEVERSRTTCYYTSTIRPTDIAGIPDGSVLDIINIARINDVRYINKFLNVVNEKLPNGGRYISCVQTSEQGKRRVLTTYPAWIAWPYYVLLFVANRVLPKLSWTKKLYFQVTKGYNRAISKAEIFGRLACCGFTIVDHKEIGDELFFEVQKVGPPSRDLHPSYGPIIKMRRIGKDGRPTYVYKLRTMHPYAEYLQSHIYGKHKLQKNGKFNNDYRIASWGHILRKLWLDELPMFINWIKGDLKLVGVRPLTPQYYELYPEDLAARRKRHKPGLIPPFYADLPSGFEEILASEERYMQLSERHPLRTDLIYLFKALYNILVKGARSA